MFLHDEKTFKTFINYNVEHFFDLANITNIHSIFTFKLFFYLDLSAYSLTQWHR